MFRFNFVFFFAVTVSWGGGHEAFSSNITFVLICNCSFFLNYATDDCEL